MLLECIDGVLRKQVVTKTCKSMFRIFFFLLIHWSLFAACTSTSKLKDKEIQLTRMDVERINQSLRADIERRYPVLKHRAISRYINGLGQAMVSKNSNLPILPYEFKVLLTNDVNVFSIPGGVIYISLGAIREFEIEAQLVAAIAHELAHQYAGHAILKWQERLKHSKELLLAKKSGTWAYRYIGPNGFLRYEPEMEREADRIAPVIMYRSQYDPRAMLSFLELLNKNSRSEFPRFRNYLALHPKFKERYAWVKDQLINVPPPRNAKLDSSVFQQIRRRIERVNKKVSSL